MAGPVETSKDLTAWFVDPDAEHDGETAIPIRLDFSDRLKNQALASKVVRITDGTHSGSERVGADGEEVWQVTVTPSGNDDVVISLVASDSCGSGIACTEGDRRPLSAEIQHTVRGPALLSVADASATEGTDADMTFSVTLSRSLVFPITVDYATVEGTATAPEDYTETSDTLSFDAGTTSKSVEIAIIDDSHDDGETFTLVLSNAVGAAIARRRGRSATTTRCRRRGSRASPARWPSRCSRR